MIVAWRQRERGKKERQRMKDKEEKKQMREVILKK